MNKAQKRVFVIAGTNSGCGKTTITLGIMYALSERGLRVQPCKVGPDYLDSSWHTAVTGVPSRNLDAFMLPDYILTSQFHHYMQDKDVGVIEGVMGLYDGFGTDPHYCSTAAMAKQLDCPVIMLVDGKAISTSIAATVMGYQHFDSSLNIAAVLINRVNSDSHFQLLKHAIEHYCHVPVIGYVPTMTDIELPSRHLGLLPPQEQLQQSERWQRLAKQIEKTVDVDQLLALTQWQMPIDSTLPALVTPDAGCGLTVAVADDAAFNFYYPDNLDLLRQSGAEIVTFSPIADHSLPERCHMIYIGGGYPEVYAEKLAANTAMRKALFGAHQRSTPIYAECGGLMYLGKTLTDSNKQTFPMVGIITGHSIMGNSLKRFGYCEGTSLIDTTLVKADEHLRGHEFHYSDFITDLPPAFEFVKERDGETLKRWSGGYQIGNTFASYLHVHFAQRPRLLDHWFALARSVL
ncbi:cobyrinate a,c-diamide synthase [Providencia stuartii]